MLQSLCFFQSINSIVPDAVYHSVFFDKTTQGQSKNIPARQLVASMQL